VCAGAITLASVGSSVGDPVDRKMVMSRFSSIGPVSEGVGEAGGGGDSNQGATARGGGRQTAEQQTAPA
jgi:hypothetical protein